MYFPKLVINSIKFFKKKSFLFLYSIVVEMRYVEYSFFFSHEFSEFELWRELQMESTLSSFSGTTCKFNGEIEKHGTIIHVLFPLRCSVTTRHGFEFNILLWVLFGKVLLLSRLLIVWAWVIFEFLLIVSINPPLPSNLRK